MLLIFDADYFTRERDPAVKELAEQARLEYIEKYGEPEEREHDSDINKDHAHVVLDELPLTFLTPFYKISSGKNQLKIYIKLFWHL